MALRGFRTALTRKGIWTRRLVVGDDGTAPVYPPMYMKPTAAPTATGAAGDFYFDSTANRLYFYDGSTYYQVGAQLSSAAVGMTSDSLTLTLGTTNPVVITKSSNKITLATGDTLEITTADNLTVGGIIVPATLYATYQLKPFATVTEYDLWTCKRAFQVTSIDCVPSTLQGGALTATVCKATGTSAPANGTTPLHTANAINLNTGAYTNQSITLTATTEDLQFAVGDRLGIDYSAAYTVGHAALTIGYKYI